LIIPDFTYLEQIRNKLKGVILTHGHEDHIGATPFLHQEFNLPIFATPFTLALVREKFSEYPGMKPAKLFPFKAGARFEVSSFGVETVHINHSIVQAAALAFETAHGYLVHLTDWKIDYTPLEGDVTDLKKFASLGKKGVLALFSDSTNAVVEGSTLSEKEVLKKIRKICAQHKGRILVTLFSSNIDRVQGLARIAKDLGRTLALVGRSMHENTEAARGLGLLSFDGMKVLDIEDTAGLPQEKVMVLATGTQGEPRSVLSRMAHEEFKPFKIQEGDLVLFSSKKIPGNEKNINYVINNLSRHGAEVIFESVHDIHTSGHAHQDELELAMRKLRPKYLVPIHGDYFHLNKHAHLGRDWGIKPENIFVLENGQQLHVENGKAFLGNEVPMGRVFVDGTGIGEVNPLIIRDRKHLSNTGLVVCVLMIDRHKGEILRGPELISRGFVTEAENQDLFDRAKKAVLDCLEETNWESRTDFGEVQEDVRLALLRFFRRELDRKPIVIPIVQEI
jgi:ribonuclease J